MPKRSCDACDFSRFAIGREVLLRHANVATTQQFYIKSVPEEAVRAVEKMDALFQKTTNVAKN